jgi:hypothetical protein
MWKLSGYKDCLVRNNVTKEELEASERGHRKTVFYKADDITINILGGIPV